jgi:hypothetical protein
MKFHQKGSFPSFFIALLISGDCIGLFQDRQSKKQLFGLKLILLVTPPASMYFYLDRKELLS